FADYDLSAFDMSLDAAKQISDTHLFHFMSKWIEKSLFRWHNRQNSPTIKSYYPIARRRRLDFSQYPLSIWRLTNASNPDERRAFEFFTQPMSTPVIHFLTQGAANLIVSFGSNELKEQFLPKMFSGEWQAQWHSPNHKPVAL
ncbi:MAG: hypothetical protein HC817_03430, partial [Saprospiraceae bacterium]|nr:hypothetical protein [Saprospiraceae bacterium]